MSAAADDLVGKVVRDTSVDFDLRYLVGAKGFMAFGTGHYIRYDSAFPGPAFFMDPAFEVVPQTAEVTR